MPPPRSRLCSGIVYHAELPTLGFRSVQWSLIWGWDIRYQIASVLILLIDNKLSRFTAASVCPLLKWIYYHEEVVGFVIGKSSLWYEHRSLWISIWFTRINSIYNGFHCPRVDHQPQQHKHWIGIQQERNSVTLPGVVLDGTGRAEDGDGIKMIITRTD